MKTEAHHRKTEARQRLREELRKLKPADLTGGSGSIRELLQAQPVWQEARAVLFFLAKGAEPDLLPLVDETIHSGKAVSFPRFDLRSETYHAAQISSASHDLSAGHLGIPEPRRECPEFPLNRLDFALVPGVGFTLDGGRLGRGKGYFDRLLSAVPGFKCGVAFDCQVVPELPLEPHDVRLDCILTPTRWHLTAGRARS